MISTFRNALDPRPVADQSLAEIHARIVGPELSASTAAIRSEPDHDKRAALKRLLPGVVFAGTFTERRKTGWKTASGLLVCDFDLVPDLDRLRASLANDPAVALLFTSPSGAGLKAVLRVPVAEPDPEQHARAFAAAERWAREVHGAELDQSGKDHSRLCFLASDPAAMLNLAAVPLDLARWAPAPEPTRTPPPPRAERSEPGDVERRALAYVERMPPSIEGQGDGQGSKALTAVVRVLRDGFDLDGDAFWRCLDAWNSTRATPPWSRRELEHAMQSVEKTPPTRWRGWLRDADKPKHSSAKNRHMPEHESADQPEAVPGSTEASIAEALAMSDLPSRLRWRAGGDAGWMVWTGRLWEPTADRAPLPLQSAVRRAIAAGIDARVIDGRALPRLESSAGVRGIGMLLSAWPQMRFNLEDADPVGYVSTPTKVLNLLTGEVLPHDCHRLFTRGLPVDPGATSPYWNLIEAHLRECLDPVTYTAMHRHLGGALVGRPADRRLLWLTGPGADSKSTLCKTLRIALGNLFGSVPAEAVSADARRGAHASEMLSGLVGPRLAVVPECPGAVDFSLLKPLSGGDPLVAKRLYGRCQVVERVPHLLIVSNHRPVVPDQASADRIIFAELRPVSDPCPELVEVLASPSPERDALASACLGWLLAGAAEAVEHGPGAVPPFGGECAGDPLAAWWAAGITGGWLRPGGAGRSSLAELRASLEGWARSAGVEADPAGLARFLRGRVESRHTRDGNRYSVSVNPGEPSKQPPSTRVGESAKWVHQGSPTPSYTVSL